MGTCIVVVGHQAGDAAVWMACASILEDLGKADVDVPLGVDCLRLLGWNRGHMTELGEEDRDHLFWKCFSISVISQVGSHLGKPD